MKKYWIAALTIAFGLSTSLSLLFCTTNRMLYPAMAWAGQLEVCDAVLRTTPAAWKVESTSKCRVILKKRFERNGYWYDEWISVQAAADNYDILQTTLNNLYRVDGFRLVDQQRLGFAGTAAPFWVMYRTGGEGESIWLALVLHMGLTYSVQMRATVLDLSAVTEYGEVLSAFAFKPDEREQAWTALIVGDPAQAERKFSSLLRRDSADANARYGYGLARLAQRDAKGAEEAIERARPQLGVSEDARRALGRAALERGAVPRAVALWIGVIRDHPGWDRELRPWIGASIARAPAGASQQRQVNLEALSRDAAQVLKVLQAIDRKLVRGQRPDLVDQTWFNDVRNDATDQFTKVLDQVVREPQKPVNLRALLAAVDVERGIGLVGKILDSWDEDEFHYALLLILSGLERMGDMASTE